MHFVVAGGMLPIEYNGNTGVLRYNTLTDCNSMAADKTWAVTTRLKKLSWASKFEKGFVETFLHCIRLRSWYNVPWSQLDLVECKRFQINCIANRYNER